MFPRCWALTSAVTGDAYESPRPKHISANAAGPALPRPPSDTEGSGWEGQAAIPFGASRLGSQPILGPFSLLQRFTLSEAQGAGPMMLK